MPCPDEPTHGPRGGEREQHHREDAEKHQQEVSELQLPTVFSLGSQDVAYGRELDPHVDPAPQQVQEEWNGRRPRQEQVEWLEEAHGRRWRAAKALRSGTPNGTSVVKTLAKTGALEAVTLPPHRAFATPDPAAGKLTLSPEQEEAAQELRAVVTRRGHKVMLLDGVTGSGKTEVYFEAMAAAFASGRQVLLLLPEIALTQ